MTTENHPADLTLNISMSDLTRRVSRLSNWFERLRHALAFDFVFARVHKTLWLDPAMAAGVVDRNLGEEACSFVIGGWDCLALNRCAMLPSGSKDQHRARRICFMPERQTVPTIPSTR
jgi:hypothetical protein